MVKSSLQCHGQQLRFLCGADRVICMNEDARSEFTPRCHKIMYHSYTISSSRSEIMNPAILEVHVCIQLSNCPTVAMRRNLSAAPFVRFRSPLCQFGSIVSVLLGSRLIIDRVFGVARLSLGRMSSSNSPELLDVPAPLNSLCRNVLLSGNPVVASHCGSIRR